MNISNILIQILLSLLAFIAYQFCEEYQFVADGFYFYLVRVKMSAFNLHKIWIGMFTTSIH